MKTIILFLLLSMVTMFSAEAHKYKSKHNHGQVTISIQTFYNELSPYGDWIYSPDYGYVWRPYFDYPEAFRPYSSNGNWVYTDYGWTWVSDYNWGWATFHYGRWDFDQYLGWLWIPGYEWAPAWVTWGYYGDYWGWAPMGPNIYVQFHTDWFAPDPWWTFVPRHHFCSHNWNHYIYDRPVHVTNITYITNVYVENNYNGGNHSSWYYGPRVGDVERYSNKKVRRMEVVDSQRADNTGVQNEKLNVFRPEVDSRRKEARPAEYRSAEQVKSERRQHSTNARSNDPGINRTRESTINASNSIRKTDSRNTDFNQVSRVEPRTTSSSSANRAADVKKESRTDQRDNVNIEKSRIPAGIEVKNEKRYTSGNSTSGNTAKTQGRNREENSVNDRKRSVSESRNSSVNPEISENIVSRKARIASTGNESVNRVSGRINENRQNTSVNPSRGEKSKSENTAEPKKSENTGTKKSVKEDVKQSVSRNISSTTEKESSAKQTRR